MHYYNARVSSNGDYLLLATRHRLGAYDNAQQETEKPEWEDYEYSLQSGTVSCASCNPSGEQPIADANEQFSALGTFDVVQNGVIRRNLTDDGRVFFNSLQPLQATVGGHVVRGHQQIRERLRMGRPLGSKAANRRPSPKDSPSRAAAWRC